MACRSHHMNWTILCFAVVVFLAGVAYILFATRIDVFPGVLAIVEAFLPELLRKSLRRIVNSLIGLAIILVALFLVFLAASDHSSR